jgi:HPt (histidine-containing phosphotransfer) domain-containing protein
MSTIDWHALDPYREMMGDAFVTDILQTYLENSYVLLNDITSNLGTRNLPEFTRAAHTLKSNSAMLGAHLIADLCLELEKAGKAGAIDGLEGQIAQLKVEHALVCSEIRAKLTARSSESS